MKCAYAPDCSECCLPYCKAARDDERALYDDPFAPDDDYDEGYNEARNGRNPFRREARLDLDFPAITLERGA